MLIEIRRTPIPNLIAARNKYVIIRKCARKPYILIYKAVKSIFLFDFNRR